MSQRFKAAKLLFQQPCFAKARDFREEAAKSPRSFKSFYEMKRNEYYNKTSRLIVDIQMSNLRGGKPTSKQRLDLLKSGSELQEFRENSSVAYFLNCYTNALGYDYVVTEQLAPKLLLAEGKDLPYSQFNIPNRCFFINLESLGLKAEFEGSQARPIFMDQFEEKAKLPAEYAVISGELFNWQKTAPDGSVNLLPQDDAIYDLIGFSCFFIERLENEFLNLLLDAPMDNVLVLNAIYIRRGSSRYEAYPFFFSVDWIKKQSSFFGEGTNPNLQKVVVSRSEKFFYTQSNAAQYWTGLNAAVNAILYLNTTTAPVTSVKVDSGISRSKIKTPKKGVVYLDKPEYQVAIVGADGFPDSWGISDVTEKDSDWVVTDDELDEMMEGDDSREISTRKGVDYLEPHTRRAHVQTFWVTERHPRYKEAKMYEMKSRGNVVKMRGLIEVLIDDIDVNVDKPSKYTSKITKLK